MSEEHGRQNFGGTHIWVNDGPSLGRIDLVPPTTTGVGIPDPRDTRISELEKAVEVLAKFIVYRTPTSALGDNPIALAAVEKAKESRP